jgi:FKBP-type peptidyl-prolyl cis-trans isomerase FkpA
MDTALIAQAAIAAAARGSVVRLAGVLAAVLAMLCAGAWAGPMHAETLPSGVVVTHLRQGSGPFPSADDTVKVHYRGTLTNGTEFDSSYRRNKPASFPLKRVIPCWNEGMQKLQAGAKAKLFCPAHTAYGARGIPGTIPPNSVLIFEVELLAIED